MMNPDIAIGQCGLGTVKQSLCALRAGHAFFFCGRATAWRAGATLWERGRPGRLIGNPEL